MDQTSIEPRLVKLDGAAAFYSLTAAELARQLPELEAMARGLGWNSNATLRADFADGPQVRTVEEARFTTYLTKQGFPVVQNGVLAAALRRADIAAAREAIQAVMEREPTLTVTKARVSAL